VAAVLAEGEGKGMSAWTDGWPKKYPAENYALEPGTGIPRPLERVEVVPLSDAERMREKGGRLAVLLLQFGDVDAREEASDFLDAFGKPSLNPERSA
jgi:hypothetical protein